MDRQLQKRAAVLYEDELQYAIARDDQIDLATCRAKAAMRFGRDLTADDLGAIAVGVIERIARQVERGFEEDLSTLQLRIGGAIRTGDLTFVPSARARVADWLNLDEIREEVFRQHEAKRSRERDAIRSIVGRMREHGGDPTTIEACPDLFEGRE